MAAIQALMNFIFFVVVAGTVLVSFWLSRKYKERYAEFPWGKTGLILAIEVLAWIVFNVLWSWVRAHPWIAAVVVVIIIIILFIRRKKEEELL
jgi:protein-S-isoprenylcysteine O-methyltransferase Ste14